MSRSRFNVAEKLALIFTSAGSMRDVAAFTGLSTQAVSYALHSLQKGTFNESGTRWRDPEIRAQIDQAFDLHKAITRQTAKAQNLPYDPTTPVYLERIERPDGVQSQYRAGAKNSRWLTNDQRDAWLESMFNSGRFYFASIRSTVDLHIYMTEAEERQERERATMTQHRVEMVEALQKRAKRSTLSPIYTKNTAFTPGVRSARSAVAELNDKLRHKHEPATASRGVLADEIRFQLDTRKTKAPPNVGKAKRGKARGTKKRT